MATINELLDIANDSVTRVDFDTANEMILNGAYIVDVREESEVAQSGKIKNAIHIPRGLIEFKLSPNSLNNPVLINNDTNILVYCAGGYRSALGAKSLYDLGFMNVFNIGGFQEWIDSGGEIQPHL